MAGADVLYFYTIAMQLMMMLMLNINLNVGDIGFERFRGVAQ